MVEFPLLRSHEDVLVHHLAEVDLGTGHGERDVGDRGQVADEEDRQPLDRHLVDRTQGQSHAVGEGEVLVDEGPGRQRADVQLARREQDLAVLPVDHVAIIVHRDEVVVGADLLELAEGLEQGGPVPKPHVLDGGGVGLDVGQGQVGLAIELPGVDAVDPPGLARGGDVVDEVRRLPGQLGRRDHELLHERREEPAAQEHRREVSRDGQDAVAGELPPDPPEQDQPRRQHGEDGGGLEGRQGGVHVGVAGADQRAGGAVEQRGDVHQPEPDGGEQEACRQEDGQVHAGGRFHPDGAGGWDDVAAQQVDDPDQDQGQQGDPREVAHEDRQGGQGEDVPAHVPPEGRVGDAERRRVHCLEHGGPERGDGQAAQQAQDHGDRQGPLPQLGGEVHPGHRLAKREDPGVGHQAALGEPEVQVDDEGGDGPHPREKPHLGQQLTAEHDLVAHLLEPPPLGQQAGQGGEGQKAQDDEGDQPECDAS